MATLIAGITTLHRPAIGLATTRPDMAVVICNDHGLDCFLDLTLPMALLGPSMVRSR